MAFSSCLKRYIVSTLFILLIGLSIFTPVMSDSASDSSSSYSKFLRLGLEATDWITSFQVAPLNASSGIPYPNSQAWGLDPYYYTNGTITAGTGGIVAGQKQELAFLLGGHDAGEGASASLNAYLLTGDAHYLNIFKVYLHYFEQAQIPNSNVQTPVNTSSMINGQNETIFNGGFWADQAQVKAGKSGAFGTNSDQLNLSAVFPAPEHGDPIATALVAYYRFFGDPTILQVLNNFGNWLVRTQIRSGEFTGAFPVTQHYLEIGWKPRMFETSESAWVLSELFMLTHNQTYLAAAIAAGDFMLSNQFINSNDTRVEGALPYVWNETHYTSTVLTNHAGFVILAWTQLFRLTHDQRFLLAAEKYANWLLSFQVTPTTASWGDHTYANDSMAVGGYYYGYNTAKHEFGWRRALSLWSAAYAIPGLLHLTQLTNNTTYLASALMAADWLNRMRFNDTALVPLQSLAIIKYITSSWWGPYPQFYQPDIGQVQDAGIIAFVQQGKHNPSSISNMKPSWFETTFSVDFNRIDYQMASRGDTFMKMIWSHWPDVGFEPRYGGDIAFGAFCIASYMNYTNNYQRTNSLLGQISQLVSGGLTVPENVSQSYDHAQLLLNQSEAAFQDGWYSIAVAKANGASIYANLAWTGLTQFLPISEMNRVNRIEMVILLAAITLLAVSNVYWYRRLRGRPSKG